jgi:hypothetical protein
MKRGSAFFMLTKYPDMLTKAPPKNAIFFGVKNRDFLSSKESEYNSRLLSSKHIQLTKYGKC